MQFGHGVFGIFAMRYDGRWPRFFAPPCINVTRHGPATKSLPTSLTRCPSSDSGMLRRLVVLVFFIASTVTNFGLLLT